MMSTPMKNYVMVLEAIDLALASKLWRAAQIPGREEEKQAMIKELDFSLVETYSLAQQAGDFNTMSSIWGLAIYAPDPRLSNLLLAVQSRLDPIVLEQSTSPYTGEYQSETGLNPLSGSRLPGGTVVEGENLFADSTRYAKAQQFVKNILSKSQLPKPIEPTGNSQGEFSVSGLLSFSNDSVRQKICGLKPTDIAILKKLGNALLPKPSGRNSMKEWAISHHLTLNDAQIDRIQKASLMFQNQMVPNDAGKLAMAARIAQGKIGQSQPTPKSFKGPAE